MADGDIPRLPTAQEKMLADFAIVARLLQGITEHATQIAATRKALFDSYRSAGFTDAQALELVKGPMTL